MKAKTTTHIFSPEQGSLPEFHVIISVEDASLSYRDQLYAVIEACKEASLERTVHFRRFFLSDAQNQASLLEKALQELPEAPTSIVQQEPLDGTRIAAWLYCTASMGVSHNGYSHYWTGSITSPGQDSYAQMHGIFTCLDKSLGANGMSVAGNTVRTWIFARDVDVNYAGVVAGRRDYFNGIGLTHSTHFIASTGIEGRHPDCNCLVEMDAYSIVGLKEGQLEYLYALDHLSPTSHYGVTFERGAMVTYGDRRHVFISGTASIDAQGKVVHEGDAAAQTGRLLENISALLDEAGAGMPDIAMAIVYLRDTADYPAVKSFLSKRCPTLNPLYVHAPVCRPAWLVEMECIAITPAGNKQYPDF